MLLVPHGFQKAQSSATGQVTARRFVAASSQRMKGPVVVATPPFTVALWARFTTTNGGEMMFTIGRDDLSNYEGFYMNLTASPAKMTVQTVRNSAWAIFTGSTTLSINTWYHLTGVWISNSSRVGYVNGVVDGSPNVASRIPDSVNYTMLGCFQRSLSSLYGNIDIASVGIWGSVLSDTHIAELATGIREDESSAGEPLAGWRQREDGLLIPYCGTAPQTLVAENSPAEISDGPVLYL